MAVFHVQEWSARGEGWEQWETGRGGCVCVCVCVCWGRLCDLLNFPHCSLLVWSNSKQPAAHRALFSNCGIWVLSCSPPSGLLQVYIALKVCSLRWEKLKRCGARWEEGVTKEQWLRQELWGWRCGELTECPLERVQGPPGIHTLTLTRLFWLFCSIPVSS